MNRRSFSICFLLWLIFIPSWGEAFVPEAPHLLYLVIEKIKRPSGFEVLQTRKIMTHGNVENGWIEKQEKLFYLYPGRFRSEVVSDKITNFSVESESGFLKVSGGRALSTKKSPVDRYNDILLYREIESLIRELLDAGIDSQKVSFKKYKGTICYVVGRPVMKGKPFASLWIEKETLFPVRYVVGKDGRFIEINYSDWEKVSRTWYPMRGSAYLDNQLIFTVDVKNVDLKSGFSPSLFDVAHLLKRYPEKEQGVSTDNNEQGKEFDRRIVEFRKFYE